MSQPEWFFDDELSRLRWQWAVAMREPATVHRGQREDFRRASCPAHAEGSVLDGWRAPPPARTDHT
jgi:hypothetical protein